MIIFKLTVFIKIIKYICITHSNKTFIWHVTSIHNHLEHRCANVSSVAIRYKMNRTQYSNGAHWQEILRSIPICIAGVKYSCTTFGLV